MPVGAPAGEEAEMRGLESGSDEEEELEAPISDIAAEDRKTEKMHLYQLHIVYSPTYQAPVLYFNGADTCTSVLSEFSDGASRFEEKKSASKKIVDKSGGWCSRVCFGAFLHCWPWAKRGTRRWLETALCADRWS